MDLDDPPADAPPVDAVLVVSFGGPEGPDDVVPFLENVTRGRGIPPERLAEVGRHYLEHFGGVSPLNAQVRALRDALQEQLDLPVYWGNRNWHPFLDDALAAMRRDGRRHAVTVVTSAFPSYSGCRQYREDLWRAAAGEVVVTRLRHHYDEEGFLGPLRRSLAQALAELPTAHVLFTAHSIPLTAARTSGPNGDGYVTALRWAASAVAGDRPWDLVFQSRSGPPSVPWLEPDVSDALSALRARGVAEVVLVPIGFTSDHVEVRYDLDVVAVPHAERLGMRVRRVPTVGTDPEYVALLASLVRERAAGAPELPDHGAPATHDRCPRHCCPPPRRS